MRQPVWKGPYEEGVSQSLLSKFLTCPHRFWLYAVCGAVDRRDFEAAIYYGDAFHNAIETYALGRALPEKAGTRIKDYFNRIAMSNPRWTSKCTWWSEIGYNQFLAYCKVWGDEDLRFESLLEEQAFAVPYKLPSGRTIILRGKWDGVIREGERQKSVMLMENKIKGEVDTTNLPNTLAQNMQVMYYLIPLYQWAEENNLPRPEGVLYNVIQRPLAGRKHAIKQKKGRKTKKGIIGAETESQYMVRLAALYTKHPGDFFYRWRIDITESEVRRFQNESLNPMLEQLCDWWDSIQGDPFDPWTTASVKSSHAYEPYAHNGDIYPTFLESARVPNRLHYRRPFGVFDKLAKGLVGDYQEYLTTGNKDSLQGIKTVFPELDEL